MFPAAAHPLRDLAPQGTDIDRLLEYPGCTGFDKRSSLIDVPKA